MISRFINIYLDTGEVYSLEIGESFKRYSIKRGCLYCGLVKLGTIIAMASVQ